MSISGALNASLTGLRTTQAHLDVLATNVANVDTPGYTRKELSQSASVADGVAFGVRTEALDRQLDTLLQRQIRSELGATGYTDTLAGYHQRLDTLLGVPGSASSFDTLVANFSTSLTGLGDNPASFTAQQAVLTDASVLANSLNAMSDDVQSMRTQAEQGIANTVATINDQLQELERVNASILSFGTEDRIPPDLLDQRDLAIDALAQNIDITVLPGQDGSVSVYTTSGVALFDGTAAILRFDQAGQLSAASQYSSTPSERSVGTVSIGVGGNSIDMIASGSIRSGTLAAFIEMRDEVLPEMQARLDEFASQMALAMSTRPAGPSVPLDPPVAGSAGLQIDLTGIQPGNAVSLTYDDAVAGPGQELTLIHVTDPALLPLGGDATAEPNDRVIGVDLTDPAAVNAALAAAGIAITTAPGAGGTTQFIDDGVAAQVDITAVTATLSVTGLQSGNPALPLFTDGALANSFYTQSFDEVEQKTGFASRIRVNAAISDDPTLLSQFSPTTPSADPTRADFLANAFRETPVTVSAGTGIGSEDTPLSLTLEQLAREIVSVTGRQAESAERAREGQALVTNGLLARQNDESGVNIDAEMARLTELQTVYAANAQVLNAAREMIDQLLAI
ncbi:MAG: flagellar hook-associated protein FlgK [Pseudomonadota bacterium]